MSSPKRSSIYASPMVSDGVAEIEEVKSSEPQEIARQLASRLAKDRLYTRVGGRCMIAVRPSRAVPNDALSKEYVVQTKNATSKRLPAHVFDIASSAYFHAQRASIDQSIVLLGESGSGKSEVYKLLLRNLCDLSRSSTKKSKVHSHLLKVDSILSAFGHATTPHNQDASCFTHYTELQFDSKGKMVGAKLIEYLLEKGRVTGPFDGGKTFHIFYYLLEGASHDERVQLRLSDAAHFNYLTGSNLVGYEKSLTNRYAQGNTSFLEILRGNLKSLGIGHRQQGQIWQLLASILHLGNVQFKDSQSDKEGCTIKNIQQLSMVAEMLGVSTDALQTCLTSRSEFVNKVHIAEFFNAKEACRQRDCLARALYATGFSWIVEQINQKMCASDSEWSHFVSILETPGFAGVNYPRNDFNRLLINYANERLYSHTMGEIFESPRDAFSAQGFSFPESKYTSNDDILNVLSGEKGGILPLIDAETAKRTSDESINKKIYDKYLDSGVLICANSKKLSNSFGIQHFAGLVDYDTTGFVDCDRDVLQTDFVTLIRGDPEHAGTSNPFLRSLFSDRIIATRMAGDSTLVSATPRGRTPSIRRKTHPKVTIEDENDSLDGSATVGNLFRSEINKVLDTLCSTQPWFIHCINPFTNGKQSIDTLKRQVIAYDIGSLVGNPATIYTATYSFEAFVERYNTVVSLTNSDPKLSCENMILQKGWKDADALVGKTSLFLAEKNWLSLELALTQKEEAKYEISLPNVPRIEGLYPEFKSYTKSLDGESSEVSDETASHFESEFDVSERKQSGINDLEMGKMPKSRLQDEFDYPEKSSPIGPPPTKPMTTLRRNWLCCTWSTTFCFLPVCLKYCGGMKEKERQLAWREKFALCVIIFLMNATALFVIVGIGYIICRKTSAQSPGEISGRYSIDSKAAVYMYGNYYVIPSVISTHVSNYMPQAYASTQYWSASILGQDVTYMFPKQAFANSGGYCKMAVPAGFRLVTDQPNDSPWVQHGVNTQNQIDFFPQLAQYIKGPIVVTPNYISTLQAGNSNARYMIINDNVYNLTPFYDASLNPSQSTNFFLGSYFKNVSDYYTQGGALGDASAQFNALKKTDPNQYNQVMTCLNGLFLVGGIDHRNDMICIIPNYILLAFSIILVSVIGFKFIAALQFPGKKIPEDHDKFVICQVPCYTEGETSIRRTIDSLANLRYDDKHKLLFIICDGMIIGSGNDRPTPRIVLDILGFDPVMDPDSVPYQSLGDANDQLNMGKVYSGLYEQNGHIVPYVVVVKCGKPSERKKPGNRGKRDSQLILLRFLSRVHFNQPMTPLELEIYHHMKNIIGVDPSFYEYIFMVDADTQVQEDSLNYLVSHMTRDAKIAGTCGETSIANDRKSFTSMIQVYEYFISHHLSKAFESLFGSVTCLPGCFSMYRVRTNKNVPVLIAPGLIVDYSENTVDTLHLKNLLHLGEDRYLTTLMMKHFPQMRTTFCPDAQCQTYAPDQWAVLLSQRRRWINSTVHNLLELMKLSELCGFCCVSMRFVVFIDLLATFIAPSALIYVGYLIYLASTNNLTSVPVISLILIAAVYGFQVVIFLLKTQWQHIGWMFFYLLAIPLFGLYIPIYSFWHFDDFSWGNTRVIVEAEESKNFVHREPEYFDPASVPLMKWLDYEKNQTNSSSSDTKSKNSYVYANSASSSYAESLVGDSSGYQKFAPAASMPSDEELLQEIHQILSTTDLMKITKKIVRDRLSLFFNIDVTPKKEYIHQCIDSILKGER